MNIIVFGKDGQLGKAFQRVFTAQKLGELHRIHYVGRAQCDLSNADAISNLLRETKPNLIINAAAYTAVDQAEQEIDLAYAVNANAPAIMAQYAVKEGATLLHYSTDYVFDGTKTTPYFESDARNPLGVYGKSKAAGEEAIEKLFAAHPNPQAQFAILRTSWVYGDGGNFIRTILRLAKERESLKVIANQFGVPTNAPWLASISLAMVLDENRQLRSFPSGIYHAIPQGETTWYELACFSVQIALDVGADLKLRSDQIIAIPASEYPLPAPRPMNSRLARPALDTLLNQISKGTDVTKWQQWQQSWQEPVADYVQDLVLHKHS
ncbi:MULTISPECIES: dTDP-4-dehydrorhamnose reductase [unclassified Polynucleobacter]|uniref:dTDP-4-dehydrorhamnose reductase n=1 Tax=unclassified Polynucleobacter TaxID=2640945 RepID=UPI002572CDD5|nr:MULTISPECIES: dTDP-4-dehydrorhamnose reductase [unclassified Polynucleobacter]BEI42133.1 dTDP-4-dehydrorhamnose reductase [Polynucleobacter sp. HIN10]BEI43911.1 dTDP-4-dehydrorhamnose reductase [Polynucleobacter sp. HIN11]